MSHSPLVEAAADYLNRGLQVIALTGKTPNVKVHRTGLSNPIVGPVETEADWELLEGVFEHSDTTGVGILTSYPYVVVDIDGEDGALDWAELLGFEVDREMGTTSAGPFDLLRGARWIALTGRGMHLWFSCITPTGTIKLGSKLDLKGEGGYVAAPPSKHPDGPVYRWLIPPSAEEPPKEVPEPLARRIEDHAFDLAYALENKRIRVAAWGPKYVEGDTVFYAQASHDALIEGMKVAADGNRNNYLHWAASTLAEEGGSDEEFTALADAALKLGLDKVEVRRTVRSARRAHGED